MRRWFRRRDKDQESQEEELLQQEMAESEETAGSPELPVQEPPAEEPAAEVVEGEPSEAIPSAPSAEEDVSETMPSAPESRGFFQRLFKGAEPAAAPGPEDTAPGAASTQDLAPPEGEPAAPHNTTSGPPETPEPEICRGGVPPPFPDETPPEEAPQEDLTAETPEAARKGLFRRFRERLNRTRDALAGGLDRLFAGRKVVDAALLEELEELLITADLGVETSLHLIQRLQERLKRRELGDLERLKAALQAEMLALLQGPPPQETTARPWVVLLVGVNGVGKTTTIAKLAHQDRQRGLTPLLVAGDTFRAAAVEQLEIWGERVGAQVVKQKTGADPAAVVFDGLAAAQARGVDTVYIDTAGRLHTKVNLMEELKKIHRTTAKKIPGAPHEILLVLDATTGQNALSQARLFHEAVGLTGIVITKMDGTAKGGVALAVAHETGIPLRFLGVGEGMDDLRPFDAEAFVAAILG